VSSGRGQFKSIAGDCAGRRRGRQRRGGDFVIGR
jgi:hypothetical protein